MKTLKYKFSFLLLFLILSTFVYADNEPNNDCSQVEIIEELNNISSTTSHTESGTARLSTDRYDYYQFTVASDGYVDLSFITNKTSNSIFIGSTCDGTHYSDTSNDTTKYPPNFNVNNGDTIYIKIERRYDTEMSYNLNIDFISTPPVPPIMGDVPDEVATINQAYSLDISSYVTLTNDDPIISYTLSGDTLPDELSFNTTTGVLFGTPTTLATYNLSVTATDNDGESNSDSFKLTVTNLAESTGGRNFEQRTQHNLFGDVKVIGNTVLCILSDGACVEPSNDDSNSDTNLQKAPQSYSTLNIPSTATVEYARIYWQGRQKADTDTTWYTADKTAAGKIKLKKESSGTYVELIADIQDFDTHNVRENIRIYSSSADASSVVDANGTYYVDIASFYTHAGETNKDTPSDGLGNYGAWMLVVVYKDSNETTAKNVTIFDGYKKIKSGDSIDISVSGFLTPKSGIVDSKTYVFAAEGDKYLAGTGDVIKMAGTTYNTTLTTLGTFDSRIDVPATRSPDLDNNNGIDIHLYDTGTTAGAKNIITTNETGAVFNFTSDQDTYFPSVIVFSTELYLPQMCYDYSIKQDGSYLDVDRDAYPIAHLNSLISSSDLEITVYLKNLEADIAAEGIAIKSDVNSSKFTHSTNLYSSNTNGSTLIDRGTPTFSSPLCDYDINGNNSESNSGCSDGHNIRKGMGTLDNGDYVYTKFFLTPLDVSGLVSIDEPLGLSLKYYITAGGNKIEYPDYILGSENVPLCPPTTSYQPNWGLFNVVHSGNTINNLYTQISRNPFNASVIFDSDPSTGIHEAPVSDINTTVMVEIIDIDSFGDINASCSNPDSSLSTPIFVPIEFTPLSFQVPLTSQPVDYYNFAVKNASFRVWYFDDTNGTLIQNWTATTDSSSTDVTAISGLYQSTIHTACVLECATDTSTDCFDCIRANYAQPICSRDNFSIRPESYAVQVYDINHTASTALKDSTKYSISNQDGFNPKSGQTLQRMKLAAGYDYRFDINATGYDGINMTPGYTRIFNGGSEYNATMIWDPQTAGLICNDETDQTLAFYVANGTMINNEQNSSNVGQYKINITDKSWTAVDWLNNTHHSALNNFQTISDDCLVGLTTTTAAFNNKYGCTISTDHGSDNFGNFYQDHDVEFFPYKFETSGLTLSYGQDDNTTFDANTFLYMADMAVDDNMALHINGSVRAVGYNNSTLSNFVNNCYAKPISLFIDKSAISGAVAFQSTFNTFNQSGVSNLVSSIPTPWIKDMNSTTGVWQVPVESFDKNMTGSIEITQNLNFDRNQTIAVNPEKLTFFSYSANCTTPANCQMNADLNIAYETKGSMDLNQTAPNDNTNISITYLYARSHAPTYRFSNPSNDALIYYETFCNGAACGKNLLPNGNDSNTTDDPRWYINTNHTSNYGTAGIVNQKGFAPNAGPVDSTTPNANHQDFVTLNYDETKGYPYKTTMQMNSSSWLIYNKYNPTTDQNEFTVEYGSGTDSWAGISETNTTTKDDDTTNRTNRRTMW